MTIYFKSMKTVKITDKQIGKLIEFWQKQASDVVNEDTEVMKTDCRTEVGITVGLIDSLISISRILKNRIDTDNEEIIGALADLQDDEDLKKILNKKGD